MCIGVFCIGKRSGAELESFTRPTPITHTHTHPHTHRLTQTHTHTHTHTHRLTLHTSPPHTAAVLACVHASSRQGMGKSGILLTLKTYIACVCVCVCAWVCGGVRVFSAYLCTRSVLSAHLPLGGGRRGEEELPVVRKISFLLLFLVAVEP